MDALKAGHSHAQVGQRPFEMGHKAPDVLIQLIKGESVKDPLYTGLDECTQRTPPAASPNRRRPPVLLGAPGDSFSCPGPGAFW